jgi:uncharacterized RDD family membrane protein YckC
MDEALPARPAGFWIRAVALAVDIVVFIVAQLLLARLARALWGPSPDGGTPLHAAVTFFTLIFALAYTTTLHVVAGQTIGKSLVGVRVVGVDGGLLTVGPAFLRHLAYFISAATFGFGFLMAGLRRDKRALHDLIAGSRVERVRLRRRAMRRAAAPRPTLQDAAVPPAAEPGPGV